MRVWKFRCQLLFSPLRVKYLESLKLGTGKKNRHAMRKRMSTRDENRPSVLDMDTKKDTKTTKGPGFGILSSTLAALDNAVNASLDMVDASRRANDAFDAYFPGIGLTEGETIAARSAYGAASDAADEARARFTEASHALVVALDAAPKRYKGRFIRNQWACVGELIGVLQSSESVDLRRAVTFLRFSA